MQNYDTEFSGNKYNFTLMGSVSKKAYAAPLKNKAGFVFIEAIKNVSKRVNNIQI